MRPARPQPPHHTCSIGLLIVNAEGRITAADAAAISLLALDPEDATTMEIQAVAPAWWHWLGSASPAEAAEPHEFCVGAADNPADAARLEARALATPMGAVPSAWAVAIHDPTEVASLRLERDRLLRIAAVSEILPSLLHELRNPLAAISTGLELFIEDHPGASMLTDMHAILGEVRRILILLQGLGTAGRQLRSNRPAAVDMAIEEAARVLEPTAAGRGISLATDVATMPLLKINLDALRGIVFNLVKNAIEASRDGGRVGVSAWLSPDRQTLQLQVSDTGEGMDDETLRRCTELFYTTKSNGSGIGLGLCKQLVDRARGTLGVHSARGVGTTIDIAIPLIL